MDTERINPWAWQDDFAFSQGWRLEGARTLVVVSGQTGVDADGNVPHPDDLEAETRLAFENMRTVLEGCGATFADVFKLTVFLLDMEQNAVVTRIKREFFGDHAPAQTTVEVSGLAVPGLSFEVEALAVA
jgi:2-iminobutanoate/2-iminopropanoate deaminase